MSLASPSADAMNPLAPKIPAPTMFDTTSAVALTSPSWRSSPLNFVVPASEVSTTSHSTALGDHCAALVGRAGRPEGRLRQGSPPHWYNCDYCTRPVGSLEALPGETGWNRNPQRSADRRILPG